MELALGALAFVARGLAAGEIDHLRTTRKDERWAGDDRSTIIKHYYFFFNLNNT